MRSHGSSRKSQEILKKGMGTTSKSGKVGRETDGIEYAVQLGVFL
jgi:hypothetical protein